MTKVIWSGNRKSGGTIRNLEPTLPPYFATQWLGIDFRNTPSHDCPLLSYSVNARFDMHAPLGVPERQLGEYMNSRDGAGASYSP